MLVCVCVVVAAVCSAVFGGRLPVLDCVAREFICSGGDDAFAPRRSVHSVGIVGLLIPDE